MEIKVFYVDAFANTLFSGNPATVCVLDEWLPTALLQSIANENNQSATAFIVSNIDHYDIKWFSPRAEIKLCGHGTLAAAYVIFRYLKKTIDEICFTSISGDLLARRYANKIQLDFPLFMPEEFSELPEKLLECIDITPRYCLLSYNYLLVFDEEQDIINAKINFTKLNTANDRGLIITAPSKQVDFVSRFFPPQSTLLEDPATGSAHCSLAPYWMQRLGKNKLFAHQLSSRGGEIECEVTQNRVLLAGSAVSYMQGTIDLA